jgi:ABC-type antimicrobial peptide transport system permease subunit
VSACCDSLSGEVVGLRGWSSPCSLPWLVVPCWPAATITIIGVAFGVPLGFVVGTSMWWDFAVSLSAAPLAVLPAVSITVLAAVIIGGAILLALVLAHLAARISPAEALREV